jgi:hypothetical protein
MSENLRGSWTRWFAAKFLSMQRRQLLELARAGTIPAYPIGDGQRRLCDFGCRSCEGDGTTNDSRKEHEECRCERTSVNSLEPMSAFRFRRVWVSSGREKIPVALRRICCCERRSCYYFVTFFGYNPLCFGCCELR